MTSCDDTSAATTEAVNSSPTVSNATVTDCQSHEKNELSTKLTKDVAITPSEDCGTYSHESDDGNEKADSTPENTRKIDDAIDQEQHLNENQQTFQSHDTAILNTNLENDITDSAHIDLLAACANDVIGIDSSPPSLLVENDTACFIDNQFMNQTGDNSNSTSKIDSHGDMSDTGLVSINRQQACTFTIDNFDETSTGDPEATALKYRNMMERFQSRHRRGTSLSKLDSVTDEPKSLKNSTDNNISMESVKKNSTSNSSSGPFRAPMQNSTNITNIDGQEKVVKLRPRDRSTSRVRDAAKRHSWSPRSSSNELSAAIPMDTSIPRSVAQRPPSISAGNTSKAAAVNAANKLKKPIAKHTTEPRPKPLVPPRSNVMQLSLQRADFICPHPPLADYRHLNVNNAQECDDLSETGTYTLDGDNYTEEQKDLMNIDAKTMARQQRKLIQNMRPKNLVLSDTTTPPTSYRGQNNILEVNYYHETTIDTAAQAATATYVSKSKCSENPNEHVSANKNVLMMSPVEPNTVVEDDDIGCFTSVTTSGVLAKQSALDSRPKMPSRSGLSTSQIDSSEFISNESKLRNAAATDHQKSEYRLNVFTNRKAATVKEIDTINYGHRLSDKERSEAALLQTAQTKNDWIQEWARNARARSLASETRAGVGVGQSAKVGKHQQNAANTPTALTDRMSHSFTYAGTNTENTLPTEYLTDDCIYNKRCAKTNNTIERLKFTGSLAGGGDGSDISESSRTSIIKPPKSPTKIPSPLHSLGRARSISRPRPHPQPHENINATSIYDTTNEVDDYLQQTAAVISSLQQSLTNKNNSSSLKSPPHTLMLCNSPRRRTIWSPEDGSPQHSLESSSSNSRSTAAAANCSPRMHASKTQQQQQTQQQLHLMTSSCNEQQLKLLTSGQYLMQQMRRRKNSFDENAQCSPEHQINHRYSAEESSRQAAIENKSLSPLRRSSSYSSKIATHRQARPQFQNLYTPPAMRHNRTTTTLTTTGDSGISGSRNNNMLPELSPVHGVKKSSSTNNFRRSALYSDYDDNLEYYINDEDEDIGIDYDADRNDIDNGVGYYSSGEELEMEPSYYYNHPPTVASSKSVSATVSSRNQTLYDENQYQQYQQQLQQRAELRSNKALLMRINRSKQKVAEDQLQRAATGGGVIACPNTPEMPRRGIRSAITHSGASNARRSVPRDVSLCRLARQVPSSLASAKKQLLQTAAAGVPTSSSVQHSSVRSSSTSAGSVRNSSNSNTTSSSNVQPKYLDISKYKVTQNNNFLRKNDAKSTLKTSSTTSSTMSGVGGPSTSGDSSMHRSPSTSVMQPLTRVDTSRRSMRNTKTTVTPIPSCMTTSGTQLGGGGGRATSAVRRDISAPASKQKEAELAMWKRRSTYDPMKAAAEDRRRKEEARRLSQSGSNANTNSVDAFGNVVPCKRSAEDSKDSETNPLQCYDENEQF